MATYDEICKATKSAWSEFETSIKKELDDYVMQATDFGVNCPNCNATLDDEDEINSDGTCWDCENTSDVSVV